MATLRSRQAKQHNGTAAMGEAPTIGLPMAKRTRTGVDDAAGGAHPAGGVVVEGIEHHGEIMVDGFELQLSPMYQVMAVLAVPLDAVDHALGSGHLDDQSRSRQDPCVAGNGAHAAAARTRRRR